jgi:transcriptional regulator with XRE-family HTH domain
MLPLAADLGGLAKSQDPVPPSIKQDVGLPTFAECLRMAMALRKVKPTDLARSTGFQARTVNNWCQGNTEPKAAEIATLCRVLRVSADYLLGRATDPCGLTPGAWVLDLNLVHAAIRKPREQVEPGFQVPDRPRIVSNAVAMRVARRIEAKRRGGR